jgi:catechol 2,3-dioxygenase-like lactoylglutathione lyase family enzyme
MREPPGGCITSRRGGNLTVQEPRESLLIKRLDHVGILVEDLAEAKALLGGIFGLVSHREQDVPQLGRRVAFFRCGNADIELIEELDVGARKQSLGDATARIEHIALEVDDLDSALRTLAAKGVRMGPQGKVGAGTRVSVWTDPSTTGGVMYQLAMTRVTEG